MKFFEWKLSNFDLKNVLRFWRHSKFKLNGGPDLALPSQCSCRLYSCIYHTFCQWTAYCFDIKLTFHICLPKLRFNSRYFNVLRSVSLTGSRPRCPRRAVGFLAKFSKFKSIYLIKIFKNYLETQSASFHATMRAFQGLHFPRLTLR